MKKREQWVVMLSNGDPFAPLKKVRLNDTFDNLAESEVFNRIMTDKRWEKLYGAYDIVDIYK